MTSKYLEETNKEFQEFLEASPVAPPKELSDKILAMVYRDLNPNPWSIFAKISLIHFAVGIITLSLCPQFGIRIFGQGLGLIHFFIMLGTYGCIVVCGAFFVGTSLFASSLILSRDELRVLRKHRSFHISALVLLSLGAFIMAGAEILFIFALAWAVGSLLGGSIVLELSWMLRKRLPI